MREPVQKKSDKQLKVCDRCRKFIRGEYVEITTRRHTKLTLCAECVRKGL